MEALSDLFAFVAGMPAIVGLFLTALIIFLTADWRLSLTALLVQYVMAGLTLTRFVRPEIAIVNILVGVFAVFILYLTGRRIQDIEGPLQSGSGPSRFLGLPVTWGGGPLGLPVRLLVSLLVGLGLVLVFDSYEFVLLSADLTLVAFWLGAMGMAGLVLGADPMRVAPAALTILTGFELIYGGLETSLAMVGFIGVLILLSALAFAYLATVQALGAKHVEPAEEEAQS